MIYIYILYIVYSIYSNHTIGAYMGGRILTYNGKVMASIQDQKSDSFHWNISHCLHLSSPSMFRFNIFVGGARETETPGPKNKLFFLETP